MVCIVRVKGGLMSHQIDCPVCEAGLGYETEFATEHRNGQITRCGTCGTYLKVEKDSMTHILLV